MLIVGVRQAERDVCAVSACSCLRQRLKRKVVAFFRAYVLWLYARDASYADRHSLVRCLYSPTRNVNVSSLHEPYLAPRYVTVEAHAYARWNLVIWPVSAS